MEDYIKIIYTLQQKKKPTPAKVPQAGGWGKGESEWPGAVEMDDAMMRPGGAGYSGVRNQPRRRASSGDAEGGFQQRSAAGRSREKQGEVRSMR